MKEQTVIIKNKLGLHARPAALVVQTASRYKSKVKIYKNDHEVDGKSIMGLMTLAAANGTALRFVADGEDEFEAINSLIQLVESGFGEE